ncbi:MAG: response regulator, partial [Gemmatimonadales bacterium]|nr:response regulator [Gemmatimonadales bacterium]
ASYDLRAGPYVCLEVEDHGVGMDEETQRRIFDPFFTTKSLGRGLGLSAVIGIVRSHGGGLYLTSAPGRGTTFTVLFPPAAEPVALGANVPAEVLGGDGLVLVVDDEPQVRVVAKRSLESAGYTVIEADNGRSALDQLERVRGHVDLVVMDVAMPVMSGGEAIQEMYRRYPDLPVVLMTGLGDPDMISDLTGRGATEYLGKPFTPDGLRRAVKHAKVSRS